MSKGRKRHKDEQRSVNERAVKKTGQGSQAARKNRRKRMWRERKRVSRGKARRRGDFRGRGRDRAERKRERELPRVTAAASPARLESDVALSPS